MLTSEFRVLRLRDCLPPDQMFLADTPERAAAYWREHVTASPAYNPEVENAAVLHLNARRRIIGHNYVAAGTGDTILVSSSEVFRAAILSGARAIILGHNHPSGEPTPSEADIKVTRDLMRAGQLLKIELLDSIILGHPSHLPRGYCSLRELGYFYA